MILESLFPKVRRELLAAFFLQPDQESNLRQLARRLQTGHGAIQREIAHLLDEGIITARREGRSIFYQANPASFVFAELRGLIEKTIGPAGRLREALLPLVPRVRAAFIYGSVAAGKVRASSDVDLMVIGDLDFADVIEVLPAPEASIGREVNPTIYPVAEFREKRLRKNPFLETVLRSPKIFVIGDEHVLEELG